MADLISEAQAAAKQANWSSVTTLLQRSLLVESESSVELIPSEQWIDLAIQVLHEGDFQEQWEIAKIFPSLGQPAIAPLTTLLQDSDAALEARWFAARILGEMNHPSAIRVLVAQLQSSDDDDLNQVVSESLANLGGSAIAALTQLISSAETRPFAVQALAQIRQLETISPLLSVVADPNAATRAIAIEALSGFRDARIPEVLVRAVKDPTAAVRKAAIGGLSGRVDLISDWNLVELLTDCLWDVNLGVCQQAALVLGKLGQDEAIPCLQRALLADQTPLPLQLDLARALSWIGSQNALIALGQYLSLNSTQLPIPLQQEMLMLLGRWENPDLKPDALQILTNVLASLPDSVQVVPLRCTIATALGELKHPLALNPLLQLLANKDTGVQLHAIAALKRFDSLTLQAHLEQLQSNPALPEPLRTGFEAALREWKTELPR